MQEKRIRAKHSITQLQRSVKDRQLQVSTRVKKHAASVSKIPLVGTPPPPPNPPFLNVGPL